MSRDWIKDVISKKSGKVEISGWVNSRRDHGKVIFLDIRDMTGVVQVVVVPNSAAYSKVSEIRNEWVIGVTGELNKRPEKMVNTELLSGEYEILAENINIYNKSKTPPFEIDKNTKYIDEELRLKYRYLDLRSSRMADNITRRHNIIKFIRNYLYKKDFREIETPYLTKSTPEGAREFIVPSRIYPGEFYVLPQSPQQFKQLLMVSGIERYFQIVRCFRDEDQRGDRQPEFTQLDIEMSFISQEDIFNLIESMMIDLIKEIRPDAKITNTPFPKLSYKDAIKIYKTDKPDLRKDKKDKNEFAFAWIVDMPMFVKSKSENKLVSKHHLFTSPNKDDVPLLDKNPEKARAYAYDLSLNGYEIFGGSIRIHDRELQQKVFDILKIPEKEAQYRFGHMLEAFQYGAPPHGGIACGVDRLCTVLSGEEVIRETMAFPKTGDARDPLMGAPSVITENQLKEVHIELADEAKGKLILGKQTETND